ncbi:hypothetical protein BsWGS_17307 [Bradybaena similaris]
MIKRGRLALKPDAFPTVFSHLPSSSLETEPVTPHKDPNKPASDKCCVPGCRSNYRGKSQTPVFRFPSGPNLKKKWLELIGRRDVNKDSVVCAKHFQPHCLITVSHVEQDDGTILLVPRTTPKLQSGALPTIFPHVSPSSSAKLPSSSAKLPSSSAKLPRKRKAFEDHNKDNATGDLEIKQQNYDIKDSTASFHSPCKENDSHIHQQMSKFNLPVISTVDDTSGCAQMVKEGQMRTRNSAKRRPHFTKVCQNFDKKVELQSLVCDEQSGTVTADIKVEIPSPLEHCQTSLELPDSTSGGESVSTVSRTSDTSQSLAPGQATGTFYCPQCSIELPDRSKLYMHFINTHINGSSKKSHASTNICAEYNDKSVNKGGCHEGVADDRDNEGDQKQTHSCTAEKSHKPEVCSTGCVNVGQLQTRKHKAHTIKHTGVKPFHCDVYGFGFTVKCNMNIHLRKHTTEKPYVCEYCGVRFVNRRQLKFHTTSHTGEKPFKCDVCMLGFNYAVSLQAHKVQHTGVKPFLCEVCGVGFTVKSYVQIHMRKHTGEKPYACEDCGARFFNRRQLKVHRISHTGEKPYKCDICEAGYRQAFSLLLHKRKHTGKEPYKRGKRYKQYVCQICGQNFSSNSAVQHHKRRHTGEKPHQCDVCGLKFSVKSSLINHKSKHTGETPYSCDVCGLKFSVITSLQSHQRKHTGEKPYLCDICGKEFAFRGSLQDHKRLHTGEKPYKCVLCFANFSNRKKLKRHKTVHTNNLHTSGGPGSDLSECGALQLV